MCFKILLLQYTNRNVETMKSFCKYTRVPPKKDSSLFVLNISNVTCWVKVDTEKRLVRRE